MGEIFEGGGFVLDTPEEIEAYRLILAWQGLVVETIFGQKMSRHVNCYMWVKRNLGFKGNRRNVLRQYEDYLVDLGLLDSENRRADSPTVDDIP